MSFSWIIKTPDPFAIAEAGVTVSKETEAKNCMRIAGSCRDQGSRLVWTLEENSTAGLGSRGLPGGFEVAFLVTLEKATIMSVHVREVKVGWGMFDKEKYMPGKYWPVTSYSQDFLLDPYDSRHKAPPEGISESFKAEDVVKVFKSYGEGLIPN
jgi:hypothetical protein